MGGGWWANGERTAHRFELDDMRTPQDMIEAGLAAAKTFSWLLVSIASVALLVGGIGIMSVMLVSVTERTREIGVRLSVGATEEHGRMQFLIESLVLSLFGGCCGVMLGVAGSYVLGFRWNGRSRYRRVQSWLLHCFRRRSECSSVCIRR
jgi:putative ABC transport system permease protein